MFNTDLTQLETNKLIECIRESGEKLYIEIGVFEGGTLKRVLEETSAYVIGVDLFEDFVVNENNTHVTGTISQDSLYDALGKISNKNRFELYKLDSEQFLTLELRNAQRFGNPNGVVFIDGNHKYNACLKDCLLSIALLNKGYIVIHNASNTWEPDTWYINDDGGPYKVVEYLKNNSETLKINYVGTFDRSAIFKKVC